MVAFLKALRAVHWVAILQPMVGLFLVGLAHDGAVAATPAVSAALLWAAGLLGGSGFTTALMAHPPEVSK